MPFKPQPKFDSVYNDGIARACKDVDVYEERVDKAHFTGEILARIHNQIAKADYVIADMTGNNVNVAYEVGYAQALNKQVILLKGPRGKLSFDTQGYVYIMYKDPADLCKKLSGRLRGLIAGRGAEPGPLADSIVVFADGWELADVGGRIFANGAEGLFEIVVHNASSKVFKADEIHFSLETPLNVSFLFNNTTQGNEYFESADVLSKKRRCHHFPAFDRNFFPYDYRTLQFRVRLDSNRSEVRCVDAVFRVHSSFGMREYDLALTWG